MAFQRIRYIRVGENVWFMGEAYDTGNATANRGAHPSAQEMEAYVRLRNQTQGADFFRAPGTIVQEAGGHYRIDVQYAYGWAFQIGDHTKAHVNSNPGLEHFEPPFAKPEIHHGLNKSIENGHNWWIPVAMAPAKDFQSKTGKIIFGQHDKKHDHPGRLDQRGILKDGHGTRDTSHVKHIQNILQKASQTADSEGRFDTRIVAELVSYIDGALEDMEAVQEDVKVAGAPAAGAAASAA